MHPTLTRLHDPHTPALCTQSVRISLATHSGCRCVVLLPHRLLLHTASAQRCNQFFVPLTFALLYIDHQFDVRKDEDQDVKLEETIRLLLAAGYFRARIKSLSPFDKVYHTHIPQTSTPYWESSELASRGPNLLDVTDVRSQITVPYGIPLD